MWFVSKKKYNELLEQKNDFDRIATNAVAQNGRLLDGWHKTLVEMREIQDLNHTLVSRNEELVAHCKELEETLNFVTRQRDHYFKLLEDTGEEEEMNE